MITPDGKTAIRRYFAGYEGTIADSIGIGIGSIVGNDMQCEWARFPIAMTGTDADNSNIIFKVSSPISIIGKVYEVGLIQNGGGRMRDIALSYFTSGDENWNGTFSVTNSRLNEGLVISANQSASAQINPIGLADTSEKDQLVLAGYAATAGNVVVTLEFDNGATARSTFAMPAGYGFGTALRSAMTKTGVVDWRTLTRITVAPSINFTADMLKFRIINPFNETLIARTVLTTPFTTDVTLPLEIEYPIGVTIAA